MAATVPTTYQTQMKLKKWFLKINTSENFM